MVDTNRLHTLTPSAAASLVGVGPHSIRRWCEWHALHLSDSANPGQGGQRRLTLRDVEVLKEVSNLRLQGLQTEQINEKLTQLTFAEIDTGLDPGPADNSLAMPDAQEAPDPAHAPIVASDYLLSIERRLAAVEQTKQAPVAGQRDGIVMFGIGFVAALLLMLAIIGLAVLYGGFR